jgi:hypothetical protein
MLEFVVDHGPLSAPALLLHLSLNPRVYYEPTPDPVYRPDQRGKAAKFFYAGCCSCRKRDC